MWTRRTVLLCTFISAFMLAAGSAAAQTKRVGVRAGVSADPEQFYFGVHVDAGEIVDRFWFRPNVEAGFGDNATVVGLNGEFVYLLKVNSRDWTPYVGGGPAVVIRSFDRGPGNDRDTDAGPGFNFVGGIQLRKGFLAEIKAGLADSPGFKFGVGWTW